MNLRNPQINQNFRSQHPPPNFRRSVPIDLPNREIICYYCNQRGHYSSQCPARNDPNASNIRENFGNISNSAPNSPRRSYGAQNSPTNNQYQSPYNRRSTINFNAKPQENTPQRDMRTFETEMPLEEIIAMAEEIEQKN